MKKKFICKSQCTEVWTLIHPANKKKVIAQIVRTPGIVGDAGLMNAYLAGQDEPQPVLFDDWDEAKFYVMRWLCKGMPEPSKFS